ncbi:helix-turn-helix domain-containing protein [Pseudomonas alloputida]|uniref:helix-turn-helix domain-containing protein n=1 Tax=Pseudomonas TaxID=286 RepID=UPI003EE9C8F9
MIYAKAGLNAERQHSSLGPPKSARWYEMRDIDIESVAKAIEADAGEPLPDLRQALKEAKIGAERVATPVATLRDWEQGRFVPPGGVLCLMRLILKHPELSLELTTS